MDPLRALPGELACPPGTHHQRPPPRQLGQTETRPKTNVIEVPFASVGSASDYGARCSRNCSESFKSSPRVRTRCMFPSAGKFAECRRACSAVDEKSTETSRRPVQRAVEKRELRHILAPHAPQVRLPPTARKPARFRSCICISRYSAPLALAGQHGYPRRIGKAAAPICEMERYRHPSCDSLPRAMRWSHVDRVPMSSIAQRPFVDLTGRRPPPGALFSASYPNSCPPLPSRKRSS